MEESGKWFFILPDRSEFALWYYCVCASITALYSQLMTSNETTLKQRCPLKGHQLFSIHITQLYEHRKAEASEQNSGFCSVFPPAVLPSVVADKSASGHVQEAPVCSVEVGSLLSMQSTFLPLPVQLSPLPVLSLQIILTLFITLHPPSPTSAVCNSPLICQPRQSSNCFQTFFKKPRSCHFLALLVSFLFCDFYVVIHLNGNFPQKAGYVPPVTFYTCFLDIWSNE